MSGRGRHGPNVKTGARNRAGVIVIGGQPIPSEKPPTKMPHLIWWIGSTRHDATLRRPTANSSGHVLPAGPTPPVFYVPPVARMAVATTNRASHRLIPIAPDLI